MSKISIWKRVGGWLSRSQQPVQTQAPAELDSEGLLVVPDNDAAPEEANSTLFSRPSKKEQQITAMEEGFNRLVDVMETINETIIQQREHNAEIKRYLEGLPNLTRVLPGTLQKNNEQLEILADEFRLQTQASREMIDAVRPLSDLNQNQVTKLTDIAGKLEVSSEVEMKISESIGSVDTNMGSMLDHSKNQTSTLLNLSDAMQQSNQNLQSILVKQNKRFTWMLVIILIVSVVAIITAALTMLSGNAQG